MNEKSPTCGVAEKFASGQLFVQTRVFGQSKLTISRSALLIAIAHTATDALAPAADCSIAVTSLELAATSYGIGSFWAGFFMMVANQYAPIAQHLNLSENHAVYAALAL